ncbi:ribosome biogenesis GTP-binding protein YihA/YsxC [uncultured Veillonella sp.]|uniref:ribosome biogenesis GTP-binding protein YihA/YsxC n=1 Tax=uncultured Veillonella sp. TaxID=159268 RepID=UPI0026024D61|nr:ribosome biogenesis GTP-binding protein YihA/YsxC [uncultured Veillonella sp.]
MKKKKQVKQQPKPVYTRKAPTGPRIIASQYVASAVRPDQYPDGDTVEIAFLGRSNVGKSSLINSLCNHRGLALVSGQPGKTKTINFFAITSKEDISEEAEQRYEWFLVDLPGYGFAKTDKSNRNIWSSFIADYILKSDRLMLLCLLVDARHPDLPIDQEAFNWLREAGVPLQIVVTKTDKLNNKEKQQSRRLIKEQFPTAEPPIFYSSLKHTGRELLLHRINQVILGDEE